MSPSRARVFLLALAGLLLAGCQTAPTEYIKTTGWENHRLPNTPQPHDRLLVEIDAVAGMEPSAAELAQLRTFLEQHTHKPGGIEIKIDNLIPAQVARGKTPNALALEFLNGPADERTAFIYVLCYRSRLAGWFRKADNPYFTYFPYPCAVFIDRSYGAITDWFFRKDVRGALLRHEIGHALGAGRDTAHTKNHHCANADCLMAPALNMSISRLLTFRRPWTNLELCADCRRDLATYRTATPDPRQRIWRGYFRHDGEGYQVLTLPGYFYVHFGDPAEMPEEKLAEGRREAKEAGELHFSGGFSIPDDAEAIARFLTQEKEHEGLQGFAGAMLGKCIEMVETGEGAVPDNVRAITSDTMIAAAANFPELQVKLKSLREKLPPPEPATAEATGAAPQAFN
jgi:hypothetical protein